MHTLNAPFAYDITDAVFLLGLEITLFLSHFGWQLSHKIIVSQWRHIVLVTIGSGNSMSPVRRHAITWTSGDASPVEP